MRGSNPVMCYRLLKQYKHRLTAAQYCTIKGQIRKGDYTGALKGLNRLVEKRGA